MEGVHAVVFAQLYDTFPERLRPINVINRSCYQNPIFNQFNAKSGLLLFPDEKLWICQQADIENFPTTQWAIQERTKKGLIKR